MLFGIVRVAGPPTDGAAQPAAAPAVEATGINTPVAPTSSQPSIAALAWSAFSVIAGALAAYHGGMRNHRSLGQTVKWGVLGGLFPVPVLPYAFVQGFAKPREDKPTEAATPPPPDPFDPIPTAGAHHVP